MLVSPAGLIGAAIGFALGLIGGRVVAIAFERRLRALDKSPTEEARSEFERKLHVMRRIIVGVDVVTFSAVGYWVGASFFG
jgi:hypothetical protein